MLENHGGNGFFSRSSDALLKSPSSSSVLCRRRFPSNDLPRLILSKGSGPSNSFTAVETFASSVVRTSAGSLYLCDVACDVCLHILASVTAAHRSISSPLSSLLLFEFSTVLLS